jgi:hypothetical protein
MTWLRVALLAALLCPPVLAQAPAFPAQAEPSAGVPDNVTAVEWEEKQEKMK